MNFNEETFLYALASRPEDAKKFAVTFKPEWLHTTEFIPILAELYAFTRKHGEPPSIDTLHKVFKDKDEEAYKLRYRSALDSITDTVPDRSNILYTMDQARDTGVVRDFQELANDQNFLKQQAELNGTNILKNLHKFLERHGDTSGDKTLDIREAIDNLIDTHGFSPSRVRIPTGISIIDKWSDAGLRSKHLGIIIAPTGGGKSTCLVIMAHNMATTYQKKVWMITNELSIEEQTERFLARIAGKNLTKVIDDPGIAYTGLERHWKGGLQDRLRITEVNREISTDEIESEMAKWVNLLGWKPDVLVLDYMERMRPCDSGYRRDQIWDWIGAIARDLKRFAKRHNILVWTAAQVNRSGLNKKVEMGLDMAQGSIKHLQESDCTIGMRQKHISQDKIVMEFTSLKQRHSKMAHKPVYLECDLGRMSITNVEYEEDEEFEAAPAPAKKKNPTPREKQLKAQNAK